MKTAKVTEVNGINEWNGSHGTVHYCKCVMDNGDKIEIGKKKPVEVGWELTYELTGDPGQQEYTKAKAVNPEQIKPSTNNNNTSDSILYQVCLKGVMDYYTQTHDPAFNNTFTADSVNELALEIARKAKENIGKL